MYDYNSFRDALKRYFLEQEIIFEIESTLKESSKNDHGTYLYTGSKSDLRVISMDAVAQIGYHKLRLNEEIAGIPARTINVNSSDAFLIDADNEWFFIEFKDCKLSSKKDNIEKKGMANWLMLMDIFMDMGAEVCDDIFDSQNPFKFARKHITYIIVCNKDKDPYTYDQVRNQDKLHERYTPECLYKFKYYFFKDAYAYTTDFFEQRFIKGFSES